VYRINVTGVPSVHRINKCANIQDYIDYIDKLYADWESSNQRYPNGWYRTPPNSSDIDLVRVENLIGLMQKYNDKSLITYRSENSTVSVYTSDLVLAKEFADTLSVGLLTQVNPMPTGVMLFKREPPAKYRAYATNNKMTPDFKESFVAYLERTPDVKPSSSFKNSFTRRYNYLWDNYYVDYDDEKNLMMMMLMFPGLIGKKYKLEKK
jgi:hypothetical protein